MRLSCFPYNNIFKFSGTFCALSMDVAICVDIFSLPFNTVCHSIKSKLKLTPISSVAFFPFVADGYVARSLAVPTRQELFVSSKIEML